MKELIKLLKNILSREPFEQDIEIRFSLTLEQILMIIALLIGLLWIILS